MSGLRSSSGFSAAFFLSSVCSGVDDDDDYDYHFSESNQNTFVIWIIGYLIWEAKY